VPFSSAATLLRVPLFLLALLALLAVRGLRGGLPRTQGRHQRGPGRGHHLAVHLATTAIHDQRHGEDTSGHATKVILNQDYA
jgi:hypothetical protein